MKQLGQWFGIVNIIIFGIMPLFSMANTASPALAEKIILRHDQPLQAIPEPIKKILKRYNISEDELSIFVQDVYSDKPLIAHSADIARNPASTMKLLTTWTALKILGPAKRWNTEVWTRGEVQDGVLKGDLIFKGYGDPFFVYESFWTLLLDLRQKGLQRIEGNILVDNSYFAEIKSDPGDFDNSPERVYNALPTALMFNFQATRLIFIPNEQTKTVEIETFPVVPGLKLDNQLKLKSGGCRKAHTKPKFSDLNDGRLRIQGNYALACGRQTLMRLLSNPNEHVFNAFRDFWGMMGGTVTGQWGDTTVQDGDKRYWVYTSEPLADQIRLMNKWSNNVMTRALLLSVAAQQFGAPATEKKGQLAVKQFLASQSLATHDLVIENGSGLSRKAQVTAKLMGEMLTLAWRDETMPEFVSSLPILGTDGTLYNRFKKQDLRGRAHLKTGTLRDVTALAGYLLNRQGKYFIVVIQHNGKNASRAGHLVQDALLEWLFDQ